MTVQVYMAIAHQIEHNQAVGANTGDVDLELYGNLSGMKKR